MLSEDRKGKKSKKPKNQDNKSDKSEVLDVISENLTNKRPDLERPDPEITEDLSEKKQSTPLTDDSYKRDHTSLREINARVN